MPKRNPEPLIHNSKLPTILNHQTTQIKTHLKSSQYNKSLSTILLIHGERDNIKIANHL